MASISHLFFILFSLALVYFANTQEAIIASFLKRINEMRTFRENVDTEMLTKLRRLAISVRMPNISSLDVTTDCMEDLQLLIPNGSTTFPPNTDAPLELTELQRNALIPMIDATAKIGSGVLRGHFTFVGYYRQCKEIDVAVEGRKRNLQGGYARLSIDISFTDYRNANACQANAMGFAGWGFDVCVPKSCSDSRNVLKIARSISINGLNPICSALSTIEQGRKTDYRTWIVVAVLTLIGIISVCGTICDYFFHAKYDHRFNEYKSMQCLLAFSLYANIGEIFNTESAHKPGQIEPIHFMRFISMCWVILGHTLITFGMMSTDPLSAMQDTYDISTQFLTNAYFAVDTFFFMSGLLLGYIWFKEYYRNKRRQMSLKAWIMFYVHRFVRLSPPYYLVVAFYAFVLKTIFSHRPNLLFPYPDSCEKNWWINYLYLTNFIDYAHQCYLVSWYLATDFQMYIFAPLIIVPLAIRPILGFMSAALIFMASTAANMATVYKYYFPPSDYTFGPQDERMDDPKLAHYTLLIYDAPWIRCQVYIIGILTGYLLQTKKKLFIPWMVNIALWIASLAIGLAVILVLTDWTGGRVYSTTESAFYSAFSKVGWGLALAYTTISCFYGYGSFINQFMSWSVWIPLGRLAYSSYLIHFCVIYYMISLSDVPPTYSCFLNAFISSTIPTIVLTLFFSIFWMALFEIPVTKVERIFLSDIRGRRPQQNTGKSITALVNIINSKSEMALDRESEVSQVSTTNGTTVVSQSNEDEEVWDFEKAERNPEHKKKSNDYTAYEPSTESNQRAPPPSAFAISSISELKSSAEPVMNSFEAQKKKKWFGRKKNSYNLDPMVAPETTDIWI